MTASAGIRQTESHSDGKSLMVADGFSTVTEAGKFLKLSRATLYNLMDNGHLPYCKFGKSRRIPQRALVEYAEKCLVVR